MSYQFTNDWFGINRAFFQTELIKFKGQPIRVLEVGCFEGRSTVWIIDNILDHPESHLDAIDPFLTEDPTSPVENKTLGLFLSNLHNSKYPDKVTHQYDLSEIVYPSIQYQYDFVYIDGCHMPWNIVHDMVNTWFFTKIGGTVVCDDYGSDNRFGTKYSPGEAMRYFLSNVLRGVGYEIHHAGWCLHLVKTDDHEFDFDELTIEHWKNVLI